MDTGPGIRGRSAARCRRWSGLLLALVASAPMIAQAQTNSPGADAIRLSLERCRDLVAAGNFSLMAQRLGWQGSEKLRKAEWGAFEPVLVIAAERDENARSNTVEQTVSQRQGFFEEKNNVYDAALETMLPTGAKLRFGYTLRDLSNNLRTNETGSLYGEYESFLGASLTQPLLKDGGMAFARIRIAEGEAAIAFQEYRRQMMLVLGRAEAAYWELYLAQNRYRLRSQSVRLAGRILQENRERVKAGKMSPLEVEEAEAGVAMRRTQASEAWQQLAEAQNQLRTFFSEPALDSKPPLLASDEPAFGHAALTLAQGLRKALMVHPDYLIRCRQAEQENVRYAFAQNQRWPRLDLKASYGLNGLGENSGDAWDTAREADFESWSVGVELRVPIGAGIRERNELAAAQLRKREALLNLKAAEVEIANNLDGVLRKVKATQERALNYGVVADFNRKLLMTELSRLVVGKSDSRKVLDVENDFSMARISATEGMSRYQQALVERDLACGTLLQTRGVEIAYLPNGSVSRPRAPSPANPVAPTRAATGSSKSPNTK